MPDENIIVSLVRDFSSFFLSTFICCVWGIGTYASLSNALVVSLLSVLTPQPMRVDRSIIEMLFFMIEGLLCGTKGILFFCQK